MRKSLLRLRQKSLESAPMLAITSQWYRARYGRFGWYLAHASITPGWLSRQEGLALASFCYALPADAVVVEIGAFLGRSAILLAGARKQHGDGRVHCIDPFDATGDPYSVSAYQAVARAETRSLRERFDANISRAGLSEWVDVHQGTAASVASTWTEPIDLLFLDGDQSPAGARMAYEAWAPFLKLGGVIALHNSNERVYAPGHDGMRLLAVNLLRPPHYHEVQCVETTTFARKLR